MFTRLRPVIAVCALALALGGCATSPHPAEPPPAFSSEAEAFAAAEETYRAYVDALNQVDLSDPATFEAVYEVTSGATNTQARESLTRMHADGWTVTGASRPLLVAPSGTYNDVITNIDLSVCLDVSTVQLVDSGGASMVGADRPDVQQMRVTLQRPAASTESWKVTNVNGRVGEPSCD